MNSLTLHVNEQKTKKGVLQWGLQHSIYYLNKMTNVNSDDLTPKFCELSSQIILFKIFLPVENANLLYLILLLYKFSTLKSNFRFNYII